MSSTLALAGAIASLDRESLTRLVRSRKVLAPQSVADPLGLAYELLRADSVSKALTTLHRDTLSALLLFGEGGNLHPEHAAALQLLGLVGLDTSHERPVPLAEVTDALHQSGFSRTAGQTAGEDKPRHDVGAPVGSHHSPAHPDGIPSTSTSTSTSNTTTSDVDTSAWYGPALTSVRRVAELLRIIRHRPVRLNRRGVPTSLAVKDLAERIRCEADEVDRLLQVMRNATLLSFPSTSPQLQELQVTPAGAHWLGQASVQRWLILATPLLTALDERLRLGLQGASGNLDTVVRRLPHDYPLLSATAVEAATLVTEIAHDLGLTVQGQLTPIALTLIEGDSAKAEALASAAFPAPVAGIYVQPDLSVIVPGPLDPADEHALSVITEPEQLGAADSLRISTMSLSRALRAGITPEDIRELLGRLSLTGIPQPLEYALSDLARTAPHEPPLPTTAIQQLQAPEQPEVPARGAAADPSISSELEAMVDRVVQAIQESGDDGALIRRIELAIRERMPLILTAKAGSEERSFTLLPLSLRSGRLRASDEVAGVERTIPLTAITGVERA